MGSENVAIVLAFHEGHNFIEEQLLSIANQTRKDFKVYLTDDYSKKTFKISDLNLPLDFVTKISVTITKQNIGFVENFLSTLQSINSDPEFYAFCDQDDIWYEDKLEKAINALSQTSQDVPALYCARTEYINSDCTQTLGYSTLFRKPPSFANALIQNIGGGNTMVFNRAASKLIQSSFKGGHPVSHDWFCYQIVTGAGGVVIYDTEPCLKYRQHSKNVVGRNSSFAGKLRRLRKVFGGRLKAWNDVNLSLLQNTEGVLTENNTQILRNLLKLGNLDL